MDILNFDELYQFAEFFYDIANKGQTATAVFFYEDAKDFMLILSDIDDIVFESIHLECEDYDGYNKEFYVTLTPELELYIEPVYDGEKIKECYSDVIFCIGEVNSKIAIENECDIKYEIELGENRDCDCGDCCNDCSACHLKERNEVLMAALDFLDFLLD